LGVGEKYKRLIRYTTRNWLGLNERPDECKNLSIQSSKIITTTFYKDIGNL